MPTHGEDYQRAFKKTYGLPEGWLGNWPLDLKRLGVVGPIEDGMISRDSTLRDKRIRTRKETDPPSGALNFQKAKGVAVDFGGDATVPTWQWLGNAKAGVKVSFGSSGGVVVGASGLCQERVRDIDALRPVLVAAAVDGRIKVGQAVIVEQLIAEHGVVLIARGRNARLHAKVGANIGRGALTLASLAFGFDLGAGSRGVSEYPFANNTTLAFRVLRLLPLGYVYPLGPITRRRKPGARVSPSRGPTALQTLNEEAERYRKKDYFALLS
jgi:hypothetical protein